ncbi:putative transmembrane protein [Gregarina niphandrodes]|uniref:Transmembrane protein n=1 Tax=Gregarina niphandrodes TaxID=110365 RepID=A0A023B7F2_GRENI|nr:putative transmembrane protein [Gregarina niphandrodes]EZG67300.1 putative transmembrane protein [Gregarina niphandrodes]|eukprot:XP_011130270.1 putative transmembrane protein [Gregarina niphandrodes]
MDNDIWRHSSISDCEQFVLKATEGESASRWWFSSSKSLSDPWVQIVIGALCVTFSRGILNALNACGAYGTGDVQAATIVNLGSSISFALIGWATGAVVNVAGFRLACLMGTTTTTVFLVLIMGRSLLHVVPLGAIWAIGLVDGIGSGVLWTSVSTITIMYPPENKKGYANTILFGVFSTGAALGGLLAFSLNIRNVEHVSNQVVLPTNQVVVPSTDDNLPNSAGPASLGISVKGYYFMIALTFVGVFLATLIKPYRPTQLSAAIQDRSPLDSENMLSAHSFPANSLSGFFPGCAPSGISQPTSQTPSPMKKEPSSAPAAKARAHETSTAAAPPTGAVFDDSLFSFPVTPGTSFSVPPGKVDVRQDLRALWEATQERSMQLLLVFAFASLFHQTYLFNGLNYGLFNVRTRGLNCFMYWLGRIPAGVIHGHVVDDFRFSVRHRAWNACSLLLFYVALGQALVVTFYLTMPPGTFDVAGDPTYAALAFATFFLYGGLDTVSQSLALWLFSVLGRNHPHKVPHYVAVYRSVQGFGVAMAWLLDLNRLIPYSWQFSISLFFWVVAFPGLATVLRRLPNDDVSLCLRASAPLLFPSLLFPIRPDSDPFFPRPRPLRPTSTFRPHGHALLVFYGYGSLVHDVVQQCVLEAGQPQKR